MVFLSNAMVACLALISSFLFAIQAPALESEDIEIIEIQIDPKVQLENSFLKNRYRRQPDYRSLSLSIPYVKLFYIGMGLDIDYHMDKEEAMDAFFFKRSAEVKRRPFLELCPKLGLGKQYTSSFLEMQVGFLKIPILFKEENAVVFVLRYGMGF